MLQAVVNILNAMIYVPVMWLLYLYIYIYIYLYLCHNAYTLRIHFLCVFLVWQKNHDVCIVYKGGCETWLPDVGSLVVDVGVSAEGSIIETKLLMYMMLELIICTAIHV